MFLLDLTFDKRCRLDNKQCRWGRNSFTNI
jgi:hypothetical protein